MVVGAFGRLDGVAVFEVTLPLAVTFPLALTVEFPDWLALWELFPDWDADAGGAVRVTTTLDVIVVSTRPGPSDTVVNKDVESTTFCDAFAEL